MKPNRILMVQLSGLVLLVSIAAIIWSEYRSQYQISRLRKRTEHFFDFNDDQSTVLQLYNALVMKYSCRKTDSLSKNLVCSNEKRKYLLAALNEVKNYNCSPDIYIDEFSQKSNFLEAKRIEKEVEDHKRFRNAAFQIAVVYNITGSKFRIENQNFQDAILEMANLGEVNSNLPKEQKFRIAMSRIGKVLRYTLERDSIIMSRQQWEKEKKTQYK